MPKRYGRKRSRKTRKRRRHSRRRYRLTAMRAPSGVPTQNVCKMRYVQRIAIAAGPAMVAHLFRANSIFDPDLTGIGHQPMGHDQMVALYNHYTVLGSKITVAWGTHDPNTECVCGVYLDSNGISGYSSYEGVIEARKGAYRLLTDNRNAKYTTCKYSAKKFFQLADVMDNTDRIGAAVGNNPVEDVAFVVWGQPGNFTSSVTMEALVKIEYIVKFSEPKEITES